MYYTKLFLFSMLDTDSVNDDDDDDDNNNNNKSLYLKWVHTLACT